MLFFVHLKVSLNVFMLNINSPSNSSDVKHKFLTSCNVNLELLARILHNILSAHIKTFRFVIRLYEKNRLEISIRLMAYFLYIFYDAYFLCLAFSHS